MHSHSWTNQFFGTPEKEISPRCISPTGIEPSQLILIIEFCLGILFMRFNVRQNCLFLLNKIFERFCIRFLQDFIERSHCERTALLLRYLWRRQNSWGNKQPAL